MDGVKILAENAPLNILLWALIGAVVVLVIGIIMGISGTKAYGECVCKNVCLIFGVPTIASIIVFCAIYFPNINQDITYDVLVDDTVSWNEFNDNYEVVSQKRDIITVKLKSEK